MCSDHDIAHMVGAVATMPEAPHWAVIRASGLVKFIHGKPTLRDLQNAVGGLIEGVPMDDESFTAFCNEEGKLEGLPVNHAATRFTGIRGDVLMGDVVIIGPPDDEGENLPLSSDVRMRLVREVAEA